MKNKYNRESLRIMIYQDKAISHFIICFSFGIASLEDLSAMTIQLCATDSEAHDNSNSKRLILSN